MALVENLQREDINPVDAALAYQRLAVEFGLSQEEVAQRVGKSRPAVSNTLRLLILPDSIQRAISAGKLSEGHGRALLGLPSIQREDAAELVLRKNLSVRRTEELVGRMIANVSRETLGQANVSRETLRDPNLVYMEEQLSSSLGTRVRLQDRKGKGKIVIEYFSAEERERLLEQLGGGGIG